MAFAAAASFPQLRIQQLPTVPYSNGPGCSAPCPFPLQVRPPTARMPSSTASGSSRLRELHGTFRCRLHRLVTHVNADTAPLQEEETQSTLSPEEEDEANVREILRVLDILKEKRDMPFNEVRLTIMIEDPWEEERREQFGVENERGCSREDIAAALVDVYEGRIPSDRVVLRELTKEMLCWPNLEDEVDAPSNPTQSPYARSTDTGIDPRVAAQREKVDWDAAAEIQPGKESEDANVPPVVGFSVLYLVSAIPILIGVGVVAILFLNSLR